MAAIVDIGTLISRRPDFKGGDAYVSGTGLRVRSIVARYKVGYTPEEIVDDYGHISLAQVYAALAYYHGNPDEIDAALAEDNRVIEALEREGQRGSATRVPA
jgi:uncharacterized protein (DUF433 family)